MQSDFLRKKACTLELLADACFDIDTSQRLRQLADEFRTVADKEECSKLLPAFICRGGAIEGNGGVGYR